ncbi:MAG: ferritin family protein, partial [Hyphomicrobiaceae bacterium]|nr:ferritin family protein [Hyphomicrobiaceae bacterium]
MIPAFLNQYKFSDLSEQQIIALGISAEEDDARIYRSYAERLRDDYPDSAKIFDGMAEEEDQHRRQLIELHQRRFGDVIPLIRRENVAGFYRRNPVWLIENLGIERIREEAANMEAAAHTFYLKAASQVTDADTRKLLGDLASEEADHVAAADKLEQKYIRDEDRENEALIARRQFILTWIQPGLA